jgi:non-specific serine/threonine protein kinase
VIGVLTALVEHHLVQRSDTAEGTGSRFSMLELVREQAVARLVELPDQHSIQERHARFFLHLAEAGDVLLADVTASEWEARLAGEEGNLRRALTWAFAQDDPTLALRLTSALTPFWHARHMQYEGRRWTAQALAHCTAVPPALQARVVFAAGDMARDQGDYTQARTHFERSLNLWQAIGHQRGTALTLQRSAFCLHNQGDYAEAERVYHKSLHWWRQPDLMHDPGLPHVLTSLGRLLLEQGQLDRARTMLLAALHHYQQQQHLRGIALVQGHLGMAALCQGDFDAACDHCERSRMLLTRLGQESAFELSVLGMAEMLRGNSAAAQQVLQAALRLRGTQGDKGNLPYCLEGLAGVALAQGDPLRAATLGGAAEGLRAASRAPFPAAARHLYAQYQTMMQAALPPAHLNTAWTTGRAMKVSQVVAYALADASS